MHLSLVWQLAILIPVNIVSFVISAWCWQRPDWGYYWFGAWMLWDAGNAAWALARGDWQTFGIDVFFTGVFFWYWWRCRKQRKRKRATELAGYKAKAIAEKIAAKQRETAQHRPVLSPIPDQQ